MLNCAGMTYNGGTLQGLQRLSDKPTVEGELEKALVAAGALHARNLGQQHRVREASSRQQAAPSAPRLTEIAAHVCCHNRTLTYTWFLGLDCIYGTCNACWPFPQPDVQADTVR